MENIKTTTCQHRYYNKFVLKESRLVKKTQVSSSEGKKKADNGGSILSIFNSESSVFQMQTKSLSRFKRKATLMQLIEDVIIHGTQVIVFGKDDADNIKEFVLNISTDDIVENMEANLPNCYTKVIDFFHLEGNFL